jgi:hypothetical protein
MKRQRLFAKKNNIPFFMEPHGPGRIQAQTLSDSDCFQAGFNCVWINRFGPASFQTQHHCGVSTMTFTRRTQ